MSPSSGYKVSLQTPTASGAVAERVSNITAEEVLIL